MNAILVLALSVGLATADIGLDLRNFKVPETSYGVPSYQYTGSNGYNSGNPASGYTYKAESSAQAGYQGGLQASGAAAGNYEANSGTHFHNTGDLNSINTIAPSYYQYSGENNFQNQYKHDYQYQTSSQYQASAAKKYQEFYSQWQQQPAQVFKHFYVHAAPEEPEPPKFRQPISLPPPQKHYKIIFIKAPTQTVYQPQYVPVPQPNQEKTIVYVLVKKPEEQEEIQIPKIEQQTPPKPEVYFVKYNSKSDSQDVINNIVTDYGKGDSSGFVNGASGQYEGASGQSTLGQYAQDGTGHSSGSNYIQLDQGQSTGGFGSSSATGSYSAVSDASASNYNLGNTISTSQGVPHETYGPPKFRV